MSCGGNRHSWSGFQIDGQKIDAVAVSILVCVVKSISFQVRETPAHVNHEKATTMAEYVGTCHYTFLISIYLAAVQSSLLEPPRLLS